MKEQEKKDWTALVTLAKEYYDHKIWGKMKERSIMQLSFSKDECIYACRLQTYGLVFYKDLEGLNIWLGIQEGGADIHTANYIKRQNCISMYFNTKDEMDYDELEILKMTKVSFNDLMPGFEENESGYIPSLLNTKKVSEVIKYLTKYMEAVKQMEEDKTPCPKEPLMYSYRQENDTWTGSVEKMPITDFSMKQEKVSDILIHTLKRNKKNSQIWEIDEYPLLNPIAKPEHEKLLFASVIVVMDHKKDLALGHEISTVDNQETVMLDLLAKMIKEMGIPKEIILNNPFVDAKIHDLCTSIGIRVIYGNPVCAHEFETGLDQMYADDSYEQDMYRAFLDKLQEKGMDIEKIREEVQSMSEEEFMLKYQDQFMDILANDVFDGEEFSFEDDEFDEELMDDGYQTFDFKNRKEKIRAIEDFFGTGVLYGEYFDADDRLVEFDSSDCSWKELLMECSKDELTEMSEAMGVPVSKNSKKEVLCDAIQSMYGLKHESLISLLSKDELEFMKLAYKERFSVDFVMLDSDPTLSKDQLLHLLSLGLIDVYAEFEFDELTLFVCPISEVDWAKA